MFPVSRRLSAKQRCSENRQSLHNYVKIDEKWLKRGFIFSFFDARCSHTGKHSPQGDISAAISASTIEFFMQLYILIGDTAAYLSPCLVLLNWLSVLTDQHGHCSTLKITHLFPKSSLSQELARKGQETKINITLNKRCSKHLLSACLWLYKWEIL